jgi:ankyrin repeat protein
MGGHKDIAELLIDNGANVNARTTAGVTPLWEAKEQGHQEIVELLRKYGAREQHVSLMTGDIKHE